jgi:hypothetical protein
MNKLPRLLITWGVLSLAGLAALAVYDDRRVESYRMLDRTRHRSFEFKAKEHSKAYLVLGGATIFLIVTGMVLKDKEPKKPKKPEQKSLRVPGL